MRKYNKLIFAVFYGLVSSLH